MTEITAMADQSAACSAVPDTTAARLKRRYAAERRFRAYGLIAIVVALGFLALLLVTVIVKAAPALATAEIALDVTFDPQVIDPDGKHDPEVLFAADWIGLAKDAANAHFANGERSARREAIGLLSSGAGDDLRRMVQADPSLIGQTRRVWLTASADLDQTLKNHVPSTPDAEGARLSARQLGWVAQLKTDNAVGLHFNRRLFTTGDSREPELAGLWGSVVGSFFSLTVTLLICFPVGVSAAIYLEEFAPRNRLTDLIEVNINNLAAVPSIVFGLLGLAIFLNFFGMPRSAPLVGGLVLALISLPTVIIAGRAALKAVPPSIRQAALALGASRLQTVTDHVLPLAMPGVLTGTILGMAHALGETAPLLMIGMVAFIVDIPHTPLDPSAVLPVQVFLWADSPERAFVEKTAAAIVVLLLFLALMNLGALLLRKKFEQRW
jgi:phosphate transport system permease protein